MSKPKIIAATLLIAFLAGANVTPVSAQKTKGGFPGTSQAELDKLRAEFARLRADLDAALKDISALKAAAGGGKVVPESGPFYRGRAASYWQEQLKDADAATRLDAVVALGALAKKDKKLIPVLIDTLKNDEDVYVANKVTTELGAVGPEALPALLEVAKDKTQRMPQTRAISAIGHMGARAKPAVPVLVKALGEPDMGVLRVTMNALTSIGPAAKEAIPALVNALDDSLRDSVKPQTLGSRFGTDSNSINNRILDTLIRLDPELEGELKRPQITNMGFLLGGGGKKGGGGFPKGGGGAKEPPSRPAVSQEVREEWEAVHAALLKKYGKPK